ncbi:hybrid sensor histidine kinase/response regulator transcription factor [Arcticibacterium luteifluviistationis]|uniref:histidine kinase n=1 Tax=Arcticibacterium luteifluviistationis TaxID=1784714 RepID=A0A2Z4GBW4_9BACT|nr:two-component regulator propeller domain-containing protein [Arcticibacterium luteifluviistationis]AWV98545.1 hybrid sensor histidine kinase/response regulator [Arcticibacterium luteifluviistationis]
MRILISVLLLFLLQSLSFAQNPNDLFNPKAQSLTFYLMDVESGLSHNVVNGIEQDSLGFMWIATSEGLNRYDGKNFKVILKNNILPNKGPADNFIERIIRNHKGQLVLTGGNGLNIFDPKINHFYKLDKTTGLIGDNVSSVIYGPNNELILGIYDEGLQIIKDTSSIAIFRHEEGNKKSLSSNEVSCLSMQGDSLLWAGTFSDGLNKINLKTGKVDRIALKGFHENINCLYTDKQGNIWIGTGKGIQVLTVNNRLITINKASKPQAGLSDDNILCFEKDVAGNLWVGTRNGGLNIIKPESVLDNKPFKIRWFLPSTDGSSVFNRTVSALKRGVDGNMWIGTSTGINFVNPHGEPIKLLTRNLSNPNTLAHNRIGSFAKSKNGNIWIGTDGGGLDYYHPSTGVLKNFHHDSNKKNSLSNDYILAVLEDSKKRVWVGTYQGGLNLLDYDTGNCQYFLQGLPQDGSDVRKITEDKKGNIWVGTNRGGLYRYKEQTTSFEYIKVLGKVDIREILHDDVGNLWLATYGSGIIKYDTKTNTSTEFSNTTDRSFPGSVVYSMCWLDNGELLAGTRSNGLFRFDTKSKTIQRFTKEDGLNNNTIHSLTRDQNGIVWLGSFNGICYFDPVSNYIGNLNTFNNIQKSEFSIGAGYCSVNGDIYLGGNKGLNIFNPKDLQQDSYNYPLVFTDLRILNKTVMARDTSQLAFLPENISYLKELNLTYNQSPFSLDFVNLKYPRITNEKYAYKLEHFHNQWIETNEVGTANFSNIPPGKYIMRVRSMNNTGHYVENTIKVNIKPPFWRTPWAYLLYTVLIFGLAIMAFRYYSERLKLKNSLLFEKKQRQLESDLNEERVRFFTGFSHELKTPLTLIMASVDDLAEDPKDNIQQKSFKMVQRNARYLFDMISKLLEFRKTELDLSQLKPANYFIGEKLSQWVELYQPLAIHHKITLNTHFSERDFETAFDLEKMQIVVNNLLSNALKYCSAGQQVDIYLNENESDFDIIVKDNGPGIELAHQNMIFDWYYQAGSINRHKGTGIGLALTKRFVDEHDGNISLVSEKGEGCVFTVTIPKFLADENQAQEEDNAKSNLWLPEIAEHDEIILENLNKEDERPLVLLIDDNPQILSYLAGLLKNDFNLVFGENGNIGLEQAIKYIPDLIISDVMMPERNGIDLCGVLKSQAATTHIPVILLSAKDSEESITSGLEKGADDYITKPFNRKILLARIQNLLDAKIRLRKHYQVNEEAQEVLTEAQKNDIKREQKFLQYLDQIILEQMANQKADVDTISQLMGMSRTSMFRKIKAITGQNINQYIRTYKLKRAAMLIVDEKLGIAQAAFEVGFNDQKYFRKLFKEQFGMLPSEMLHGKSKN